MNLLKKLIASLRSELGSCFGFPDSVWSQQRIREKNLKHGIWRTFLFTVTLIPISAWGQPTVSSNGRVHFILTSGSTPYGFGENYQKALGDGTSIIIRDAPVLAGKGVIGKVISLSAGAQYTSLAVTDDGKLWAWGGSSSSGYPPIVSLTGPSATFSRDPFVMVSSGVARAFTADHWSRLNLWLTKDGNLDGMGELIREGNIYTTWTTPSSLRTGGGITWAGAGISHYAFIQNGTLYGRYGNQYGQLGDNTGVDRTSSIQISTGVRAAAVGISHTLFIDSNYVLWGTGDSNALGTQRDVYAPIRIASNVIRVSAQFNSTFFITADGSLYALGANPYGQLGDGTKISRTSPVRIASDAAEVSGGVFLSRSGAVYLISGADFRPKLVSAKLDEAPKPPTISQSPSSVTVALGSSAVLSVAAESALPLSYQWAKEGIAIIGATGSNYILNSVIASQAGNYSVTVSNSAGTATSAIARLTVVSNTAKPRLSNLSVRTTLDANQVLIVGMTMAGGTKNVLLRAVGPTLGAFGVPDVMPDPKLDLYSGLTRVTSNDNWQGLANLVSTFQAVGAFALSSASSLDAALLTSIDGGRTVQVSGSTAGTVLVEGYDAGSGDSPRFSNLSARNKVGTGANILIAGFTLSGIGTRNVLIRAVGPKLADFGVSGVLQDPKVQIYHGQTVVAENDNWAGSLASTFSSVGAFGLTSGSKDAALVIPLQAGSYTVQVSGADGGTGEAIVEIYELP